MEFRILLFFSLVGLLALATLCLSEGGNLQAEPMGLFKTRLFDAMSRKIELMNANKGNFKRPEEKAAFSEDKLEDEEEGQRFSSTNDTDAEKAVSDPDSPNQTYGVIVDCGSSGTRAHLYEWDTNKSYPELLHDIEPMRDENGKPITKKVVPGLSSLADTPEEANDYIQPIIDFVVSKIPAHRLPYTGVYILATAGMRLLDEETQRRIMTDIAWHLKRNYNFVHVTTSVISGADEGMYQWISVNAKAKRFLDANTNPKTPTYAVVEMGGASIQVTYQLRPGMEQLLNDWLKDSPEAMAAVKSQIVEPQISRAEEEHNFRLVSVTFLGLGGNSAREAYIDMLIKNRSMKWLFKMSDKLFATRFTSPIDKNNVMQILDPCMPKGSSEIMYKPLSMLESKKKTVGFYLDDDEPTIKVEIKGTSRYSVCKAQIRKFLQRAKDERMNCKENEACSMSLIGHNFIPWHRFDFRGLSDFYYTTSSMLELSGRYNHKEILTKTRHICFSSYSELLRQYPDANKADESRVRRECWKAVFIDTFLLEGLRMPATFKNFKTVNEIEGDDLEWTLGAVLDKSLSLERATSGTKIWSKLSEHVVEKARGNRLGELKDLVYGEKINPVDFIVAPAPNSPVTISIESGLPDAGRIGMIEAEAPLTETGVKKKA